jgi:putative flavoprotein involved in K+ transport
MARNHFTSAPFVPPPGAQKLDVSVTQLQSADYATCRALPDGPVLVVGGGNSGLQIVRELATIRRVDVSMAEKPAMVSLRLRMSSSRVTIKQIRAELNTRVTADRWVQARREFVIGASRRQLKRAGVTFR